MDERVRLAEAARRLGWRYLRAYDAVLQGRLEGKKVGPHWLITVSSIRKLQRAERRNDAA
jgi:phage FluMu gp28-like protein